MTPSISHGPDAFNCAVQVADRWSPREAGGLLVGWRTDYGIHISGAIEVPAQKRTRTSYVRTERAAARALSRLQAQLPPGSPVGYVGEWHSHPSPTMASPTDFATISAFATDDGQRLALIVLVPENGTWRPVGWHTAPGERVSIHRVDLWMP